MNKGEVNKTALHRVEIIESERGYGQKLDEVKYFDTKQNALSFCSDFNKCNVSDSAPDWYMQANYVGTY